MAREGGTISGAAPPHVGILMAVRNGARDLPAQLDSFSAQHHRNWTLIASDDGSDDRSREIVAHFGTGDRRVIVLDGPGLGAAANFLSLLRQAPTYLPARSWLAFSDQDDVWLPHRLSAGISALQEQPPNTPALHCTRTWIVDADLAHPRLSPSRPRALGFRNALVQNVVAGNTILLNPSGAALACAAAQEAGQVVMHDWWLYLLMSGAGAKILHAADPGLLYRQHSGNEIGANDTARARLRRLAMLTKGTWRRWNDMNIAALSASRARLTPENAAILAEFEAIRRAPMPQRLLRLYKLGLYRQTRGSQITLLLAAALGLL